MGRPGIIVTRMNSHGWIFCGSRLSLLQSLSFSAKLHSQSSSAPRSVVMAGAGDPVAPGLVESLARPGRQRHGQSSGRAEVAGKCLPPLPLTR
jgi:hypothetical protein